MSDHAAFLRGMNLGRRRIANEELRSHFAAMGLRDVATFRASGNVIFSCPQGREERALGELIERSLQEMLGYAVPTFLRTREELLEIAARRPFDADTSGRLAGKLQVALLGASPAAKARREALASGGERDGLAFGPRELYWLPAGPMSESELDLKALEKLLGPMTIRTKGTIELIATRHLAA